MTVRIKPCAAVAREVPLLALLFLCFFQLLTDFVAGLYALGLLQTDIPTEIVCVLLCLAPAALLIFPAVSKHGLLLTGALMLSSRIASLVLETRGRMLAAGIGTAAFLLFLPGLLSILGNRRDPDLRRRLAPALALATLLQVLLRAMAWGNDITAFGPWRLLGAALALATGALLWVWVRSKVDMPAPELSVTPSPSAWRIAGLCVGMMAVLTMLYLGTAAPTVMARWTESDAHWMTAAAAGTNTLCVVLALCAPTLQSRLSRGMLGGWNLMFLLALTAALWASRVPFPTEAGAYPLPEPPVGFLGHLGLYVTVLLSPVLYVNFAHGAAALSAARPPVRQVAFGFTLGALWLLMLTLAHVFTTVYDYIPVVGLWFRDRFWVVVLTASTGAILPALLVRPESGDALRSTDGSLAWMPILVASGALGLGAIGATALGRSGPPPPSSRLSLRVMTFNLQQGYNAAGAKDFAGQLEVIRRAEPDLVGLQETDTARIAGGNSDLVRFLEGSLGYYAHPGPRTGAGTFGIALLSRFPLERARTFYLYSRGEQTAVIEAEVRVGDTTYRVFVTHLGNGGPLTQQRQVLELVAGKTNVILMGDFNFRPGGEPYRLTSERLADAWLQAMHKRADPPNQNLDRRIDHVFVSPDTRVLRADYLDQGVSDHPAVVVEIGPGHYGGGTTSR